MQEPSRRQVWRQLTPLWTLLGLPASCTSPSVATSCTGASGAVHSASFTLLVRPSPSASPAVDRCVWSSWIGACPALRCAVLCCAMLCCSVLCSPSQMFFCEPSMHAAADCAAACSPTQAWEVFTRTRVTEAQWAESALDLLADASLYCCIGEAAYPWSEAAPAVLGCLAFGTPWQANVGPGIQLAVPRRLQSSLSDTGQVTSSLGLSWSPLSCRCLAGVGEWARPGASSARFRVLHPALQSHRQGAFCVVQFRPALQLSHIAAHGHACRQGSRQLPVPRVSSCVAAAWPWPVCPCTLAGRHEGDLPDAAGS